MMRPGIIATALAAALLPTFAWASRQTEDARLRAALRGHVENSEAVALADSGGHARRAGDVLIVKPSKAAEVRFRSAPKRCIDDDVQHCVIYTLVAYLPSRHAYLVDKSLYEGGNGILIDDRTGRETVLPGIPLFSPDSNEVVSTPDCFHYQCRYDLEIWKRTGDHFVFEWGHAAFPSIDEVSIDLDRWDEPDRITASLSGDEAEASGKAMIVRKGGRWRMDAKMPARPSALLAPKAK